MKLGLHFVYIGTGWLMLAASTICIGWEEVTAFFIGLGFLLAGIGMIVKPKRVLTQAEVDQMAREAQ